MRHCDLLRDHELRPSEPVCIEAAEDARFRVLANTDEQ
jgi:hypothetical protein